MTYSLNFNQYLEIGGVPLSTPAWEVLNIHTLMSGPATRGENLVIPGATGIRAIRHRNTEKTVTLQLGIWGDKAPDGTPYTDREAGVWTNWLSLRNQFNALLLDEGASTVLAVLHYRGGTIQGQVQVLGYDLGDTYSPFELAATLDVNILAGMLT